MIYVLAIVRYESLAEKRLRAADRLFNRISFLGVVAANKSLLVAKALMIQTGILIFKLKHFLMPLSRICKTIHGDGPGRSTELNYFRIGPESADKKVYLQAALHADEQPGIMVLHHLLPLLEQAEQRCELNARFVIFPMVNPLGMADISLSQHQGRYDKASGVNHNRQWPDLFKAIQAYLTDDWSADEQHNQQKVQRAVADWLAQVRPVSALQQQKHIVMQEAYDADYVFDLHELNTRSSKVNEDKFAVFQNRPNPFMESTNISFFLPEASDVELTITDVTGKRISRSIKAYTAGKQNVEIKYSDLGVTGILYYTIKAGEYTATKKMINVR